jgi:hypothetical protein
VADAPDAAMEAPKIIAIPDPTASIFLFIVNASSRSVIGSMPFPDWALSRLGLYPDWGLIHTGANPMDAARDRGH